MIPLQVQSVGSADPGTAVSRPDPRVLKAIAFMKANMSRHLATADIAAHVKLSSAHFSRLCARQTGFSPKRMLKRVRVEHAAELLVGTDLPEKDIASRVAMADAAVLIRAFKASYGMTPRKYRQWKTWDPGADTLTPLLKQNSDRIRWYSKLAE